MIRLEVTKKDNESAGGLIRRFSKKVQSSSVLKKAKRGRYHKRPKSDFVKKKDALNRIEKKRTALLAKKAGKLT